MIIYKTTNLINGKIYIGKDKYNNPNYLGSGKILKLAIKKYGIKNFKKDIIEWCCSEDDMNEKEKYWIYAFRSISPIGYNLTIGGDGGNTFSYRDGMSKSKTIALLSEKSKYYTNLGIGIAGKSIKGMHISDILNEESAKKWKDNYQKSMMEYSIRRQCGILTDKEKIGLEKLRVYWNSDSVKKHRSQLQLGIKNSNYRGPYKIFDGIHELEFQFLKDVCKLYKVGGNFDNIKEILARRNIQLISSHYKNNS